MTCCRLRSPVTSSPPPAPLQYIFTFSYDDNGEVHMAAGGRSSRGKRFSTKEAAAAAARAKGPTLSQVKYQVCRLMRMLVEVTNTLEQVRRGDGWGVPGLGAVVWREAGLRASALTPPAGQPCTGMSYHCCVRA